MNTVDTPVSGPQTPVDDAARERDLSRTLTALRGAQRDVERSTARRSAGTRERAQLIEHMRHEHGWSYRRIAQELGLSHNSVVKGAQVYTASHDAEDDR